MTTPVSELSIRELHERFADAASAVSSADLAELKRDPRRGAQALYAKLKRQIEAERQERERLAAMLRYEQGLWSAGIRRVAGVDEAGMAPLAGPVVAAAVVFPPDTAIEGIDDSKRLPPERRDALATTIRERAADIGIGISDVDDIEHHNIYWAGVLAMRRAVEALPATPEHVLVDARTIPDLPLPQDACTRGDQNHASIAAASIIAKTHRDGLMTELDHRYPGYGFAKHKGYPTAEHQHAIRERGPCPAHRTSFNHFRELLGTCSAAFYTLAEVLESARTARDLAAVAERLRRERPALAESEHDKLRTLLRRRQNRF